MTSIDLVFRYSPMVADFVFCYRVMITDLVICYRKIILIVVFLIVGILTNHYQDLCVCAYNRLYTYINLFGLFL